MYVQMEYCFKSPLDLHHLTFTSMIIVSFKTLIFVIIGGPSVAMYTHHRRVYRHDKIGVLKNVFIKSYSSVLFSCLRGRHYVFGLSVSPSKARNTLFPPVHGSVGPSDQP